METIQKIISIFGVSLKDILSKKKNTNLCDIRKIIAYELRQQNITYQQIGWLMHRDHSTIVYQIREYEKFLEIDKIFREKVKLVESLRKNV